MDSLFANYASSDEEGEDSKPQNLPSNPTNPIVGHRSNGNQEESELTNSHPKSSSSLFGSLPPPKSSSSSSSSSSSLFSTVPAPKSRKSVPAPQLSELNSSVTATKKVVQFRPPPIGLSMNSVNEDEDDDDDEDKKVKQKTNSGITTVKSLFSSMPAPKNSGTFGALPSASGTGRRSMLEADVPATSDPNLVNTVNNEISNVAGSTYIQSSVDPNSFSGYAGSSDHSNLPSGGENYAGYDTTDSYQSDEAGGWGGGSGNYGNYGSGYANNDTCDYASNSADRSITRVPSFEIPVRLPGKRGRNEVPTEIIEVNQDDLMKNRPREDKAKATGIAFGPSYQPVSAKGKPSKLLKRKHQIGSLYFDMKQNETLLQERRSKGLLTKAQTHAKYGWA